jgi:hypothetical protein
MHVLVSEDQAEHRHEHNRERHDREEDAVGDAGGELWAAVGEVAVDCGREHPRDPARRGDAPAPDGRPGGAGG